MFISSPPEGGRLLGTALGIREALFVATIAASLGGLWLLGSRVLRLRDLPEPGEVTGG